MSQTPLPPLPPQMPPPGFYYGQMPYGGPTLPSGAKAMAIIALVISALGSLSILSLPLYFKDFGIPNPVIDVVRNDKNLLMLTVASQTLHCVFSLFLLTASIRVLKLRPSARAQLVVASAFMAVLSLISPIINMIIAMPVYRQMAAQHPNDPVFQTLARTGPFTMLLGTLWVVFYIFVIYFFTRDNIKALFAGQQQAQANPPSL